MTSSCVILSFAVLVASLMDNCNGASVLVKRSPQTSIMPGSTDIKKSMGTLPGNIGSGTMGKQDGGVMGKAAKEIGQTVQKGGSKMSNPFGSAIQTGTQIGGKMLGAFGEAVGQVAKKGSQMASKFGMGP